MHDTQQRVEPFTHLLVSLAVRDVMHWVPKLEAQAGFNHRNRIRQDQGDDPGFASGQHMLSRPQRTCWIPVLQFHFNGVVTIEALKWDGTDIEHNCPSEAVITYWLGTIEFPIMHTYKKK